MGNDISQACTQPPLTLRDCLVDGQIDLARYQLYAKRAYEDKYEDTIQSRSKKRKSQDNKPKQSKK